jgi:hypothetical protein
MTPSVPVDPPQSSNAAVGTTPAAPTGLERECLRQAVHDVRGPLNTTSVLVDLVVALLDKDPELARAKAPLLVRELQTVARMLDHLVGSSDTLATSTVAMDLSVSLGTAVQSFTAPAISVDRSALAAGPMVRACPQRLPRLLSAALDRCAAALPNGGSIAAVAQTVAGTARLVLTARGGGVVAADGRPHLTAGPGWFPVLALARGMGGDVRLQRAEGALCVELDLPLAGDANP